MDERPPAGATLRVDRVTAAILAAHDVDIDTILGTYEPTNGTGPGYETNAPALALRDGFGAPDLTPHADGGFATTNAFLVSATASLHGPMQEKNGSFVDPIVAAYGVNLSDAASAAAVGRTLAEVVDVTAAPHLASLARVRVTRILNGDTSRSGGCAHVHVHLDPTWRETRIPDHLD